MSAALLGTFPVGSWAWHTQAREPVRIIEVETLWVSRSRTIRLSMAT